LTRDEDLWAELREIAPDLRFIYFASGEPFLQPLTGFSDHLIAAATKP
jgi:hypothetical protein